MVRRHSHVVPVRPIPMTRTFIGRTFFTSPDGSDAARDADILGKSSAKFREYLGSRASRASCGVRNRSHSRKAKKYNNEKYQLY